MKFVYDHITEHKNAFWVNSSADTNDFIVNKLALINDKLIKKNINFPPNTV